MFVSFIVAPKESEAARSPWNSGHRRNVASMSAKHPQFSNAELRALALKDPALFEAWSVREAINQNVKERIRFLASLLEPERPELTNLAIKVLFSTGEGNTTTNFHAAPQLCTTKKGVLATAKLPSTSLGPRFFDGARAASPVWAWGSKTSKVRS